MMMAAPLPQSPVFLVDDAPPDVREACVAAARAAQGKVSCPWEAVVGKSPIDDAVVALGRVCW